MNIMTLWNEEIHERVKMQDVLERYCSGSFKPHGRCKCPLHNGKDKNFSYNEELFQCFVCGESGNVISFVAKMFDITNKEATFKIDADFNLGITKSKPKMSAIMKARKAEKQKKEKEKEKEELAIAYQNATDYLMHYQKIYDNAIKYEFFDIAEQAIRKVHYFEAMADELLKRSLEDD